MRIHLSQLVEVSHISHQGQSQPRIKISQIIVQLFQVCVLIRQFYKTMCNQPVAISNYHATYNYRYGSKSCNNKLYKVHSRPGVIEVSQLVCIDSSQLTGLQLHSSNYVQHGVAYINICVSKHSKEELSWAVDEWLQVISNKILFKMVIPLRY